MGFDVSALSSYVQDNSRPIAIKAIAGAQTAAVLISNKSVQSGVKGSDILRRMDQSVSLQDGSSCSRTPLGSVTLSDKRIKVAPIAEVMNLCPKALYSTFFSSMIAQGQTPSEDFTAEFAAEIMDSRAALIAAENEVSIWQADTANSSGNHKYFDGIIKQANAGGAHSVIVTGATGTLGKLQSLYLAVPAKIRSKADFRLWIGEDTAAEYMVELANKNVFKSVDDKTIYGTLAKFEVVAGLNGTNKAYAFAISNVVLGIDGTDDADQAELRYSIESKNWYLDFSYSLGVSTVFDDEIYYAVVA